ncbi:4'-phosphopantetheinyl transferase superfamily protein [Elizabethkingia sp. JS20170427COW]|uniref:4'-phosphopantetheinyl transferase family protein n=1 Tax=Elizabethkingia sp. JS20170427COW TaxID=2583851 RepID=UPI001110A380|nr:4'-phosphopantetheinyl transferase superfamily protein [Elizabethkingia sp. JS20170427COW]QCX52688.1 4'-phosphopantetheinyl transferase superfamily protein [Elizabethkingia sp. JS20170427COW]
MPLYQDFSNNKAKIWIWKYDENDLLNPHELLHDEEFLKWEKYHPKKQSEMLMVRKMLKDYLPHCMIKYFDNGEPYLENSSFEISITHSFPFAALAIGRKKIGIDLEKVKDKIIKIENKFILHEFQFIPEGKSREEYLTAIWCVKEALYKIHSSKFWSLKKNYEVLPFDINSGEMIKCRVYNDEFSDYFSANLKRFDNFIFAEVSE